MLVVAGLIMFSCREDDFHTGTPGQQTETRKGTVDVNYRGQTFTAWKNEDGDYIVGEDMVLYKNEVKELSSHNTFNRFVTEDWDQITDVNVILWPMGPISFRIDANFTVSERASILKAIQQWNEKTHLLFIEVPGNESIYFKKVDSGCRANIGYPQNGGKSTVSLGPTCDLQSIIHEIGHVAGLIHEHQKTSRNNYISLKSETFDFIKENFNPYYQTIVENLKIERTNQHDPFLFDMQSVMMYGSYPRNNLVLRDILMSKSLPLFTKKDGSIVERPTLGLTAKDIMLVSYYYTRKLILKNVDYNVVRVKIRTEGDDPGIIVLNPDEEIVLYYNNKQNKYTYNGHILQQIGLNNGNDVTNYIKFSWSGTNDIRYFMKVTDPLDTDGSMVLIKDYVHPENTEYYHFTNRDGIDGGSGKAIIESVKKDDYSSYIYLKRWNSNAITDGKKHSFDKYTPSSLKIRNINYGTLNNIVMKFTDCSSKKISLAPGQTLALDYTANGFSYGGCKLKQLDFNNGKSSDDLNFSQSSYMGEVTYQASSPYMTTIIDINNAYMYGTVDPDGIDGKGVDARLDAYVDQGTMFMDIRK